MHKSIHEYIDGYCTPEEALKVSEHVSVCNACLDYLNSVQELKAALGGFSEPEKTDTQWAKIENAIYEKIDDIGEVSVVSFSRKIHHYRGWIAAAVLVFMLISLPLYYFNGNNSGSQLAHIQYPSVVNSYGDIAKNGQVFHLSDSMSVMNQGEMISTASNSKVVIKADSGSTIELSGNSNLAIKNYSKTSQTYLLKQGSAKVAVAKRKRGQLFVVETPNALCEVIGTRFTVDVVDSKPDVKTILSVEEGVVRFKTPSGDFEMVTAGNSRSITNGSFDVIKQVETVIKQNEDSSYIKSMTVIPKKGYENQKGGSENKGYSHYDQKINGAAALIDSGRIAEAFQIFEELISSELLSSNQQYDVYMRKFRLLKMTKSYSEASSVLELIINGNFKNEYKSRALFQNAALLKSDLQNKTAAIEAYQRYINDFAEGLMISEAFYNLAELYHENKQYQKEAQVYEHFIEKLEGYDGIERAVYSLARLYTTELNDCSKAVGLFAHLEAKYSKSEFAEDALFWKANCLYSQGRVTQAFDSYRQYINTYPNGRWAAEAQARMAGTESVGRN